MTKVIFVVLALAKVFAAIAWLRLEFLRFCSRLPGALAEKRRMIRNWRVRSEAF